MKINAIFQRFPAQTFFALVIFVAILVGVHIYWNPSKGLSPSQIGTYIHDFGDFTPSRTPVSPVAKIPDQPIRRTAPSPQVNAKPVHPVTASDPFLMFDQPGLDHFYQALAELQAHSRATPVRIIHYGDSPTSADLITGENREQLQRTFGDAGHGFLLVAKPWEWYEHRGMSISDSGWKIETAVGTSKEAAFGLGGAYATGTVGAQTEIKFRDKNYSYIDLYYLSQPGGGDVLVRAGGKPLETVSTSAEVEGSGFRRIQLPVRTADIELEPTSGTVRLYGVDIEKEDPGITYDSLGLNGASTIVLSRIFKKSNWAEQLSHRSPDLVIVNYGTNESGDVSWIDQQYETELRYAIAKLKEASPQSSILIMSPMDRGDRTGAEIHTMPGILHIVEIQKRVAKETGCGFFNTFEAMGGESTMGRWYDGNPRLVAADLIHPNLQGAGIVSDAFVKALILGFESYKQTEAAAQLAALPKQVTPGDGKVVH
jgi:lysophospholipase L1-like esterase